MAVPLARMVSDIKAVAQTTGLLSFISLSSLLNGAQCATMYSSPERSYCTLVYGIGEVRTHTKRQWPCAVLFSVMLGAWGELPDLLHHQVSVDVANHRMSRTAAGLADGGTGPQDRGPRSLATQAG